MSKSTRNRVLRDGAPLPRSQGTEMMEENFSRYERKRSKIKLCETGTKSLKPHLRPSLPIVILSHEFWHLQNLAAKQSKEY